MYRTNKREISKTTSGSPEFCTVRTESAFAITCCSCDRTSEAREFEIDLPKSLGQKTITWTQFPDGWWQQGPLILNITVSCPGCMETPMSLPVSSSP